MAGPTDGALGSEAVHSHTMLAETGFFPQCAEYRGATLMCWNSRRAP